MGDGKKLHGRWSLLGTYATFTQRKDGDVWSAVSGTPGIQETVAAFITGWIRTFGKETLEEALMSLARMSCFNIAKFFWV